MLSTETATQRLHADGLRMTPQRRAVIESLVGDDTHPTTEVIAARVQHKLPGVSLSTVYTALHELADKGLVLQLDLPGGMRFDPNEAAHPHLVCSACGSVVDAHLPRGVVGDVLDSARSTGIHAETVSIEFHGLCRECANG